MRSLVVILLVFVIIDAGKTYPGKTVFDNQQGEYLKVIGPTLGPWKASFLPHPPIRVEDTISYSVEIIPSDQINALFIKGDIFLEDFPVWSEDGTENHCDHSEGANSLSCPLKAGVKIHLNGSIPIQTLSPLTLVLESSEDAIKSIELQLVRVETCGCAEGYAKDATEIQNLQIADGDVCRGFSIPIYMIFPRLFTCPSLATTNFKIEFELNLVIIFSDDHLVTENFPIRIYRP